MPAPEWWTDTDRTCDHCGREATEWREGLMCIDREQGVFTCDFIACPDCTPETTAGLVPMLREGVEFSYILWYWFKPSAEQETMWQTCTGCGQSVHLNNVEYTNDQGTEPGQWKPWCPECHARNGESLPENK